VVTTVAVIVFIVLGANNKLLRAYYRETSYLANAAPARISKIHQFTSFPTATLNCWPRSALPWHHVSFVLITGTSNDVTGKALAEFAHAHGFRLWGALILLIPLAATIQISRARNARAKARIKASPLSAVAQKRGSNQ
jgi:hypothetical protein